METNTRMRVCGIMSGTSLDGVDVAIVDFEEQNGNIDFNLVHFSTVPYSHQLSERLRSIVQPSSQSPDISSMNMLLGDVFANAVNTTIQKSGLSHEDIDLISSHGQTIYHDPIIHEDDSLHQPSTLQIGDISVIAEKTGIPTIGDFRTRDIAVGGQGAPLVPFVDYTLLRSEHSGRILVNIGGISNLTVLKKSL
ncbi:anhydro-N-acetylmuramic acid kinase [Piscibacillus salipiscarius]|uniref:anhydro-N-acetylmuramic acid kinase n=1 Tax=Piscibacillus salipiscarius TaxID=299480 RepID=UPI0006CF98A2|nr:anhydro-N-acetylmuramic acid kinase [Piscibacillus salipiscarius]